LGWSPTLSTDLVRLHLLSDLQMEDLSEFKNDLDLGIFCRLFFMSFNSEIGLEAVFTNLYNKANLIIDNFHFFETFICLISFFGKLTIKLF